MHLLVILWEVFKFCVFMTTVALLVIYLAQEKFLYYPVPNRDTDQNDSPLKKPSEVHLNYDNIELTTSDSVKLHGWLIKTYKPKSTYTVVFFHENSGNIGHRMNVYYNIQMQLGANIIAFDYRGYGKSTGTPHELGFQKDCDAIMQYISTNTIIDNTRVFLHGKSLGGSLAIDTAYRYQPQIKGLIIENTFANIVELAKDYLPFFLKFGTFIFTKIKYPNLLKIAGIRIPILFISGSKDQIVNPRHMSLLYNAAVNCKNKENIVIKDAGHENCDIVNKEDYYKAYESFVNKALELNINEGFNFKQKTN